MARVAPRGAAEDDSRLVLPRGSPGALDQRVHAHPHPDRLLDARISVVGILLLAIPAVRGLRFGTVFATTLALLSMIPLTFLAIAWIFNPSAVDFSWLWHFRHTNLTGFFHPLFGHGWLTLYLAFSFLLTWNVIAMA
jgi:hypothetical protein